jgi:F-type H+-transporting ATPase subunit alpha
MSTLAEGFGAFVSRTQDRIVRAQLAPRLEEGGRVTSAGDGVARVSGLPSVRLDEIVVFEDGSRGLAVDLDRDEVGCVLLDDVATLGSGARARGTGEVVHVPVGEALLGRIVDPLGRPLDGLGPIEARETAPIEKPAPSVVERQPVCESLHTGVTALDALLPIGRGQRELILGDRSTGKTSLAVDAIIAQRDTDVVSVYCAIGQKSSAFGMALDAIRRHGNPARCIFVYAAPDAPPGLQWLAPYAACSMAEFFSDKGGHALLVLDDLTKHAKIHREVSLLLRRPPGREAYPGDVFYTHSRLLERSARLDAERGGGSLTALPIAETQAGDLSAYVPTNLISITDGQIYLEPRLFNEGVRPSIDVGRSVSRVGAKSQTAAMRAVSSKLRLEYAQFLELEVFARFGGELDDHAKKTLERGWRIREALVQRNQEPLALAHQVALLLAISEGILDVLPRERVARFRERIPAWLSERLPALQALLERGEKLGDTERSALAAALRDLAASVAGEREGAGA